MTAAVADVAPAKVLGAPAGPALSGPALAARPKPTAALMAQFPPRQRSSSWPETTCERAQVVELVCSPSWGVGARSLEANRQRGLPLLLDWLEDQPGDTWQQRWLASGVEGCGADWADDLAAWLERQGKPAARVRYVTSSMELLVGAGIVRPSLWWLLSAGKGRRLARDMIRAGDAPGFAMLHRACQDNPVISAAVEMTIASRCTTIIAAKGGQLVDITAGDVLELLDAEAAIRIEVRFAPATFKVLRDMGVLGVGVPAWRELRRAGQLSPDELVDRYPLSCRPVRDLIVAYLKERQASVDYGTLVSLAYSLVRCFWADLEAHHPGIDSLRLAPEVASGWKGRLRTRKVVTHRPSGETVEVSTERFNYLDVLSTVRAFYLDLAEWALEDPGRWAPWVAACPVRRQELSRRKFVRQRKARMDARTRERLPLLPVLARAASQWHKDAEALLAAGRVATPGEQFHARGHTLVRSATIRPRVEGNVWAHSPDSTKPRLLNREEEHAFWAWAIIEVLRFTGLRVEELLELSHYSLVKYRLPGTGELVPLLQVAPSKTDAERVLVVSPDLADVLSKIILRVRGDDGAVRLVRAWDYHEHLWLPPSPLLFQHRVGPEHKEFNVPFVSRLINEALARTAATETDGRPLHCTPHDFRRMFITDAVLNGLPPHIAQVIAGHHDINVTMGYKAVYPEETLQAHLSFLARRRALRPTEEYRVPTEQEWQDFFGHFEKRKVSVGTCGRAFATPCIHEHACVRCALLWPDPAQRGRLIDIRDNLAARISEAKQEGWLGEVEGLEISLAGAHDKLAQLDRRTAQPLDQSVATSQ